MSTEEIAFEPPQRGRRGYGGVVLALVVVGVVVWLLVSGHGSDSGSPAPSPSASQPSATPTPTDYQRPGIADAKFALGEVCAPVKPTKRTFDVRFTLVNPSPAQLVLLRVVPALPLGGLQLEQTLITFGGCQDLYGPILRQPTVGSGGSVLVVFRFRLPPTCPQPLPVQADVTSRVFNVSQSGQRVVLAVYPDLGSMDFATCP